MGRLGVRYAKRFNIPLVFTYHTLYDQYVHYVPFARSISKKLMQKLGKDFCNQCDLVIAPTGIVENYIKKAGVNTTVINIPTGIDIEEFKDTDSDWLKKHLNLDQKQKILLHVGRMGKEKNVPFLLKSFKEILKIEPEVRLVIVGGGPEEKYLQNLAGSLEIKDYVYFTGILPRRQVIDAYAGADIFVFASLTETQGLVLCEAKAAGLPVVAINAFGASEMVDNHVDGFLTKYCLEKFTEKILLLVQDDDLRKEMSKSARINANKMSSYTQTNKLIETYERLLMNKEKTLLKIR